MTGVSPTALLAVDVGNSAIKLGRFRWPCRQDFPEPTDVMRLDRRAPELASLSDWLRQEPTVCYVASVHRQAADQLLRWFRHAPNVLAAHVLSSWDFPLQIAVRHPERVGPDRLAAAVAAIRRKAAGRAAIVIDAGSAITVDAISPEDEFLGGAILPGPQSWAGALATGTDLLPHVETSKWRCPPAVVGKCTEDAIQSGIFWGTVGAIREVLARTKATFHPPHGAECNILLTGGFMSHLAEHVAPEADFWPHLVLTGIAIAACHPRSSPTTP